MIKLKITLWSGFMSKDKNFFLENDIKTFNDKHESCEISKKMILTFYLASFLFCFSFWFVMLYLIFF